MVAGVLPEQAEGTRGCVPAEWGNRQFLTCLACAVGGRLGLGTAASASPCRDNSEVQVARLWGLAARGYLAVAGLRNGLVCCEDERFDGRKGRDEGEACK